MFADFSFDTPRSPSIDSNDTTTTSRSVSPCSPTTPYPTPQYSVTDLSADFGRQRLRQDSQIYSQPCEAYANLDDDAGWSLEAEDPATPHFASRVHSGSAVSSRRRTERQASARLLCSTSHHRDIAALVSRMVGSQEQCFLSSSTSITHSPVEMDDDCAYLPTRTKTPVSTSRPKALRRSSDLKKTGTSISKDARLRKDRPRHQKSSDKS